MELDFALNMGYQIKEVYEIWDWSEKGLTSNLFHNFVNTILKWKVENAGAPVGQEEKLARLWRELEGIVVNEEKLKRPKIIALYTTSKYIANSLWSVVFYFKIQVNQ